MQKKDPYPDRDAGIDGYVKIDRYNPELIENLSEHYKGVLEQIGEDPGREGLLKTPERVAKAMLFLGEERLDGAACESYDPARGRRPFTSGM